MRRIWHTGPPPNIGWWPASTCRNENILRWWNGSFWSIPSDAADTAAVAARQARVPMHSVMQPIIEWTDRPDSWPARSKT